ncbi:MAG: metallophosphoesterase [Planctomycetaceae bacterium]
MRITSFNNEPISEIPFLNAGRGQGSFYVDRLPVHVGHLSRLPDDLDAIIATADLQGRERFQDGIGGPPRLLGEVLPERLAVELLPELNIIPERVGVILAGDFYTVPNLDKRGGSGDVTSVWQAFAGQFKWVVGVAGNHDTFGCSVAPSNRLAGNAHYLDGESTMLDDVNIAGIGGIVGNRRKPHRKSDEDFVAYIEAIVSDAMDILVMHDGPDDPERGQRGSPIIRQALERLGSTLLIRGHAHWHEPFAELANGTQVLNVDCRVSLLRRSVPSTSSPNLSNK